MTEAQMERAIEFLLDHQAQFATDISILKESQAETRSNIDRVVTNVDSLSLKLIRLTEKVDEIAEAQTQTQVLIDKTQEQINALAKQQARTSGELEHFMNAMQGFVTEVRSKLDK